MLTYDQKELKKLLKLSNKPVIDMMGHKIQLPGFHYWTCWYDSLTKKKKFSRNQAPVYCAFAERIEYLMKRKLIYWFPHLEEKFDPETRRSIVKMQKYAFIVIDFDKQTREAVLAQIEKVSLLKGKRYIVVTSVSGQGCHLVIWVNLSHYYDAVKIDYTKHENAYKNSARFRAYTKIYKTLVHEIETTTSLKVDIEAFDSHIAWNPLEIAEINSFYKGQSPTNFNIEDIKTVEKVIKVQRQTQLDNFFQELNRLLIAAKKAESNDWSVIDEICNFNVEYGTGTKTDRQKMLYVVYIFIKNFDNIKNHMLNDWQNISIYASKQKELGAGCDGVLKMFGLESESYKGEIRRLFLYMFNLKLVNVHIIAKKTGEFNYMPDLEDKLFFKSSFLDKNWWKRGVKLDLSPDNIKQNLGNSKTHDTIKHYLPPLVHYHGMERAISIMLECLDCSCANDKTKRKRQIKTYARAIEYQMDLYGELPLAA